MTGFSSHRARPARGIFERELDEARICRLPAEQQLLLGVLRRWLAGIQAGDPAHWKIAWRDLSGRLGGGRARVLLAALEALLRAITVAPRRAVSYHPPCCSLVTTDEMLLLALVQASQAGDRDLTRAVAERMVTEDALAQVLTSAKEVAEAARAGGLILAQPDSAPQPSPPPASLLSVSATVH